MLITQALASLLNGVSQRPQEQRLSSQAEEQINAVASRFRGLTQRPPTRHVAKLVDTDDADVSPTGFDTAFVHPITLSEDERYQVTVVDGTLRVFDAIVGTEYTVIDFFSAMSYLDNAEDGYRASTFGDTTVVVNRSTEAVRGDTKADAAKYEAIVFVRMADYGTSYSIVLNGSTITTQTVAGSTAAARPLINTDYIAQTLYNLLVAEPGLSPFSFALYGSTIYMTRTDGADFTVSTSDGLADQGLKVVKGSIQAFADLPRKAPDGFVVLVSGDPESDQDDYWVRFEDSGTPDQAGVWKEIAKPGTLIDLDATTMPHRLVRNGDILHDLEHFKFGDDPDSATLSLGTEPSSETTVNWTDAIGVATISGGAVYATQHTDGGSYTFIEDVNNVTFDYSLNTTNVPDEVFSDMVVYLNDAEIDRISLLSGTIQTGTVGPYTDTFDSSDVLKVTLEYSTGSSPDFYQRASLVAYPITYLAATDTFRGVWFQLASYPVGTLITITAGTTSFPYTVTGSPATGATIAAAFATAIDADPDYQASVGTPTSVVKIKNNAGTNFDLSVTVELDSDTIFYDPDLDLTTDDLIGYIVVNETDGSTGTVTGNSSNTITVSALTGGADDTFAAGDVISIRGSDSETYFVFEAIPWKEREAGDPKTIPFPSLIDHTIDDVFFYGNRLGFLSQENIIMSRSGDFYNLFRQTATQVLPDDVIDVRSAHAETAVFHSAVLWNKGLYVLSGTALWLVSGEPVLSPQTVRIDLVAQALNSRDCRPLVLGNKLYVARKKGSYTQVQQFFQVGQSENGPVVDSFVLTEDIPEYINGAPVAMAGDADLGFLAVLTDEGEPTLYTLCFSEDTQGRGLAQVFWNRWEFATGTIAGFDMVDGYLNLVAAETSVVALYSLDLNSLLTPELGVRLDRLLDSQDDSVTVGYASGITTWTMPYVVATDGSDGVLVVMNQATGVEYEVTRPTTQSVTFTGADLSDVPVWIGVRYTFNRELSRLYYRKEETPELEGRTTIRYISIHYTSTQSFSVVVTLAGRDARTYTFTSSTPASGTMRIPIQGKNDYATIELQSSSPHPCAFTGIDWEGDLTIRARRV